MNPLIEKTLQLAEAQAVKHVHEIGDSNSGPEVDQYLAAVNTSPGNPWCAGFVFWCIKQVLHSEGRSFTPGQSVISAYVPTVQTVAKQRNIWHEQPARGDLMLLCDSRGPFHIGFVTSVTGAQVATIEGNTSSEGSGGSDGNGGGVHHRVRSISSCEFVRWIDLVAPATKKKETP